VTRAAPRTDRNRAALVLWGTWLLVTGLVFSFMQGIFHAYYSVALAPAAGALVGIGATLLWNRRHELVNAVVLGATLLVTALWAHVLLARSSGWHPWLATAVVVAGVAVAALIAGGSAWLPRRAAVAAGAAALIVALTGPTAYALQTSSTPHAGSIPSAGPQVAGGRFGGPGGGPRGLGGPGRLAPGLGGPGGTRGPGGGIGGLLQGSTAGAELVAMLEQDASSYTWVAAAIGSNNASGYQLATGQPVMAIGGFNGSDPSPTLAQFQQLVAEGKVHYFIAGGTGMGSDGGSSASQQISSWVTSAFGGTTVGGVAVYDLTSGAGATVTDTSV
jgi:4-amino-4-deoxy-L-arabinose transferase-like glycosyltransferase